MRSPEPAPVAVHHDGRRTLLKWHRARRRATDPEFTAARIVEGMRVGASVEIDLRVRADRGFAVQHDRDTAPILLLEELAELLNDTPIAPKALLQLDFKDTRHELDAAAISRFTDCVAPFAQHAILSCGDPVAVRLLTEPLADIRIGYDPCHGWAVHRVLASRRFTRFVNRAAGASPHAEMVYLERRLILGAERAGVDLVEAFHRRGRTVDAYTVQTTDASDLADVRRLLGLRVDQITTDDPEGLFAALHDGA